jgi:RHS repeat-associated protein
VNDPETGLTYMQQRYYDPMAGRFMSVDPVLTDGNTGASFNRYVYANNNPHKYTDPDGRNPALVARVTFKISFEVASALGARRLGEHIGIRLYDALNGPVQNSDSSNDVQPNLVDDKGATHILDGDGPDKGGGHRAGTGKPGKSEFPAGWTDEKILGEVSDVATSPDSTHTIGNGGRTISTGTRGGIDITTVTEPVGPKGGRIVTGFPTNVPRNPPNPPPPPKP